MAKNDMGGTILSLGIVLLLIYVFKNSMNPASGTPVIASFAGTPTAGFAAGGPAPFGSFNIDQSGLSLDPIGIAIGQTETPGGFFSTAFGPPAPGN